MKKSILLVAVSLLSFFGLKAQVEKPVSWNIKASPTAIENEYEIECIAKMSAEWNIYSTENGDEGPIPTNVFLDTKGVKLVGKAVETGHRKSGMDDMFGINVIKYLGDKPYTIKVKVSVPKGVNQIAGYINYMTCNDTKCIPEEEEFNLVLPKKKINNQINSPSVDKVNVSDPVIWDYSIKSLTYGEYELAAKAIIAPGWNIYGVYSNIDGGVPTSLSFEDESIFVSKSKIIESGKVKKGRDPIFKIDNVVKYLSGQEYILSQKVKLKNPNQLINAYLTYMTCDDNKCLPPTDIEILFDTKNLIAGLREAKPLQNNESVNTQSNIINQRREKIVESLTNPHLRCNKEEDRSNLSLLWLAIFGFGGGLLALLTPCVFPMIPLTVSFFTKDHKHPGWLNGLIYGLSIIIIYVTVGLLITSLFGAEALNRLATNWIANTIFFIVFVIFAFSFFGFYEIQLPSSWANNSDRLADKGGFLGMFFMAFTLALVSFSCTGPIIGTALVQSATSKLGPLVVMLSFSLALALPFGLFAAFPSWLKTLPKSGSWMTTVKMVLGFLELALAFKFLSVADMTNHWGILRYELFLGIWIVIFLLMGLYLLQWIKFGYESQKIGVYRKIVGYCVLIFTAYLITGFTQNPTTHSYTAPKALSGLAPPSNYNFFLPALELDLDIRQAYPSYSKCSNNINCFKDYSEGLEYAKKTGKPMLLDFTGYGCVNCRKTEDFIWVDEKVRKMLNDDYVLVSLYVDDDTPLPKNLVSEVRNKTLRNVGNKWADFQIVNFNQNSQPLYVVVNNDEEVLSHPRGYREGIQGYIDFLECGLNSFKEM